MKKILIIVGFLAVVARPAFAQSFGNNPGVHITAARAAAIQECNAKSNKYPEYVWGNVKMQIYRGCMAGHHQVE